MKNNEFWRKKNELLICYSVWRGEIVGDFQSTLCSLHTVHFCEEKERKYLKRKSINQVEKYRMLREFGHNCMLVEGRILPFFWENWTKKMYKKQLIGKSSKFFKVTDIFPRSIQMRPWRNRCDWFCVTLKLQKFIQDEIWMNFKMWGFLRENLI